MTDVHVVPPADFADLASGWGSRSVVERLRAGQLSKNLLILHTLLRAYPVDGAALQLLDDARQAAPDEAAGVLTYPMVGAWAADCLRVLRGSSTSPLPVEVMLGHLAGIAAAAAFAAGLDFSIVVPARAGAVSLPGYGRASVPGRSAVVSATNGQLEVDGVSVRKLADSGDWLPVVRLEARADDLTIRLALDDVDWYRDCSDMGATARLSAEQVARWREVLQSAWEILAADHRDYAVPILAGLEVIVPLRGDLLNRGVTATSMDAFGAMLSSMPADPLALAVGLVHEFQHGKLGALMDLVPLHTGSDEELFYAPWRDDPRPLGGLLHGAYAYLAVAGFWRVERRSDDPVADFEFARWRAAVAAATDALLGAGHLTPTGVRFVTAMRGRVRPWLAEPVPPVVAGFAERANADHRLRWRLRNVPVDPRLARALAGAWRAGGPPPGPVPPAGVRAGARALERSARLDLVHARLRDPHARPDPVASVDPVAPPDSRPDPAIPAAPRDSGDPAYGPGDRAYARGDPAAAARAYRATVAGRPGDDAAWAGLALTDPGLGPVLRARPELIAAVYRAACIPGGRAPDLDALAAWLAPSLRTP